MHHKSFLVTQPYKNKKKKNPRITYFVKLLLTP